MRSLLLFMLICFPIITNAQDAVLKGKVVADGMPVPYASVLISGTKTGTRTDSAGYYELKGIKPGIHKVTFSSISFESQRHTVIITGTQTTVLNISLKPYSSNLNEVVITGVSRATELRKNPVPVAVMSKTSIEAKVSTNIIESIVKGVPGVNAVTTGPNISKPFIRGLGYNRVLTLYDGIRQEGQQWGDEHGIEIDAYGLGRVEVVKGPASLTYGSDALAGVINLIPDIRQDSTGFKGDFTTEYHSNNGMTGNSLGLGYNTGNWRYSLRGTFKAAHDYRNPVDGYVYNTGFREMNFTGIARTDKKWGYAQIAATLYNNNQEIPDGSRDSLTRRFTKQVSEDDDIKNRPLVTDEELRAYTLAPLRQSIKHYRLYGQSQFKIGQGSAYLMTGLQRNIRREFLHPSDINQASLDIILNTLNYEARYNLPSFSDIESTIGVNGFYQTNRNQNGTTFPIPDYNLFDIGTYIFAKKSFGKVDVSGGVRYDNRRIRWHNFYVGTDARTGFDRQVDAGTPGAELQFPAFSHNYTGLSGSFGLTYNITGRLLIKANIARGYRAPNITEIGSNGLDPGAHIVYLGNRTFKPEFSLQQDVGFIAYLNNMDISLELFNNNIDNYIYQAKLTDENGNPVVIVEGNTTYQYQQSKARLYGAELTWNLRPESVKWLAFNNSLAYVTGINKNEKLIQQSNGAAKYLPFIPPLHVRSELKFTIPGTYGAFSKIFAGIEADMYGEQDRFYALDDTETYTPAYTLINLSAGATIGTRKKCLKLFFQADNVFNKAYQSNLNRLKYFEYYQQSPNSRLGIYNMGRNISLKVVWGF
ncbi:TonB-dependent receptor [Mucilaginibacter limnophilus]|uniref:TonB-dependent receptor n=1 Tax=Mucilaginibacter limnophilus TaxID=1932778 RepID=A0A437MWA9_9SPHI|nr:TonB-dependent receptor [Mucilaginibacter limnophilus]RVU01954.1 TonB-dependent receptor [Mucilaginibacter limnophilus]